LQAGDVLATPVPANFFNAEYIGNAKIKLLAKEAQGVYLMLKSITTDNILANLSGLT
jgi:hypothetical protein